MPTINESIIENAAQTWFWELGCSRSTFSFTHSLFGWSCLMGRETTGQATGQELDRQLDKLGFPVGRALARLLGLKPYLLKGN